MVEFLFATSIIIFAASPPPAGQPARLAHPLCDELQRADAEGLAGYLHGARPGLKSECIRYAIEQLAIRSAASPSGVRSRTAQLIVPFLDLEDPFYEVRRRSPGRAVLPTEKYPAIAALMIVGKPSLPELLNVIRSVSSTAISRSNAVSVISYLYREDPEAGVKIIER